MITDSIILRAGKKNPKAQEQIYLEFKDFVWNVALKTTRDRVHAEDVTAEVFVKIFKNVSKFKFKASFKTWVYRMVINTALNYMSKERIRKVNPLKEDYGDMQEEYSTLYQEIEQKDIAERLLSNLDSKNRLMLILREIEGLSYKEIADALKMNLNAVKINIYRARDRVRALYKEMGGVNDAVQKV